MGSNDGNDYGAYTYDKLEREPYWPSEKLRISVTGAGGFIGSHIARRLKREGHYVIASDWKKNEHMTEDMFCNEFHLVDLRVMDNCLKVTKDVDHVFNLAADMGGMGFIQSNHSVIMYNNQDVFLFPQDVLHNGHFDWYITLHPELKSPEDRTSAVANVINCLGEELIPALPCYIMLWDTSVFLTRTCCSSLFWNKGIWSSHEWLC